MARKIPDWRRTDRHQWRPLRGERELPGESQHLSLLRAEQLQPLPAQPPPDHTGGLGGLPALLTRSDLGPRLLGQTNQLK